MRLLNSLATPTKGIQQKNPQIRLAKSTNTICGIKSFRQKWSSDIYIVSGMTVMITFTEIYLISHNDNMRSSELHDLFSFL
jgi:hypothetical protein